MREWESIFKQNVLSVHFCGKRGGKAFINAVRMKTGRCPERTQACSKLTSQANTICVEHLNSCPITDMALVGSVPNRKITSVDLNRNTLMLQTNQEDSLPLIDFKVARKTVDERFNALGPMLWTRSLSPFTL